LFVTLAASAQGGNIDAPGRLYGIGHPQAVSDLPSGQLKAALEGLSPAAQDKALDGLQGFSFPAEDVAYLRVDPKGSVLYVEAAIPDGETFSATAATSADPAGDPQNVFKLHSRPGSSNVVFLDFDGHRLQNTAWNSIMGQSVLDALPFDPDYNDSPKTVANFTLGELNRIAHIWHRVAADFAPFDIDVTTEEPTVFTPTTGHVIITDDLDAGGRYMPYNGTTGAAHVDVFGSSDYADYPALVYWTNLYRHLQAYPPPVAESVSHEFGHQLGLSHKGLEGTPDYYTYQGHGLGMVSWAPIMGAAQGKEVTQWDRGEYPGATNPEDDLAIIGQKLGFIADDHADSSSQATALTVDADGTILASSPELDPDNVLTENKGLIGDRDDVDWFYVDVAGSGTLEITATPSWHSFTLPAQRGENLDIELSLFDSDLTPITTDDPKDNTNATVTAAVSSGRYYLQLDGVGNSTDTYYSDYGSIGMYFIEGSVPMDGSPPDTTPPSPAQMSWQSLPTAASTSSISMTAVTATDDSGSVEYYFTCVSGGPGCSSSGWRTNSTFTDSGLQANTSYSYKVTARDAAGNTNTASSTASATTEAEPDTAPPSPSQLSWTSPPAATGTSSISMTAVAATDDSGSVEYSFTCVSGGPGCSNSSWQTSRSYTDSGLQVNTSYSYKVTARDAAGNANTASATANATTEAEPDTTPPSPSQMSWASPPADGGPTLRTPTAVCRQIPATPIASGREMQPAIRTTLRRRQAPRRTPRPRKTRHRPHLTG
jgi:chitodextrinase